MSEQERAELQALALAAEAGIHRLAIPTPFMVGRVNAYLIEDSPLTLIDSCLLYTSPSPRDRG